MAKLPIQRPYVGPVVRIRPEQDDALQALVPAALRGSKKRELRVQWALDEFLATMKKERQAVMA